MEDRDMRASDAEREEVAKRLRVALDEGRLKLDEYLDRMGQAYEAVTRGELAVLEKDLPAAAREEKRAAHPPAVPQAAGVPSRDFEDQLPPIRVLRTIWLIAVSVNVVVWALVSLTKGSLVYPWPIWVAGPFGVVILILSAKARAMRHEEDGSSISSTGTRRLPGEDS
jgi:hypothetical protein